MREINKVKVGKYTLGDGYVAIQSMLSVNAEDIQGNIEQAIQLEKAGCEILRVAIPNEEAVSLIPAIKDKISIPLVADIHFDYKLALLSAEAGIDKIRINPGNIGGDDRIKAVVDICKQKNIPIRIGVNSGSAEKELLAKYGGPTAECLVESALNHAKLLQKYDFNDIVVSIKSSNVMTNIQAYTLIADKCNFPLHLGVTEAGTSKMGIVKNSIGIGSLLANGIGDTIRVSLTADPIVEIETAQNILKAIGIRKSGVEIVSCPTCGRTQIDLIGLANKVEDILKDCDKQIKVAVMGCVVNGPGEAKEADYGIAGGKGCGIIFKKGQVIKKVDESELLNALLEEINKHH